MGHAPSVAFVRKMLESRDNRASVEQSQAWCAPPHSRPGCGAAVDLGCGADVLPKQLDRWINQYSI